MIRTGTLAILPAGAVPYLRRRLADLAGVTLFVAGLALFLALLSFDPGDPSFNHATGLPTLNLFGRGGAYTADLLLHGFGWAALVPVLGLLGWGWRLLGRRPMRHLFLQGLSLLLAMLLLATALAAVPALPGWPIAAGSGGGFGVVALGALAAMVDAGAVACPPDHGPSGVHRRRRCARLRHGRLTRRLAAPRPDAARRGVPACAPPAGRFPASPPAALPCCAGAPSPGAPVPAASPSSPMATATTPSRRLPGSRTPRQRPGGRRLSSRSWRGASRRATTAATARAPSTSRPRPATSCRRWTCCGWRRSCRRSMPSAAPRLSRTR
ncbi:MAG: DNA translocase FtsK 4TM domain-containing protein [Rhodospirillales bacterium]